MSITHQFVVKFWGVFLRLGIRTSLWPVIISWSSLPGFFIMIIPPIRMVSLVSFLIVVSFWAKAVLNRQAATHTSKILFMQKCFSCLRIYFNDTAKAPTSSLLSSVVVWILAVSYTHLRAHETP